MKRYFLSYSLASSGSWGGISTSFYNDTIHLDHAITILDIRNFEDVKQKFWGKDYDVRVTFFQEVAA